MTTRATAGRLRHDRRNGRESFSKKHPKLARALFARDRCCVYCGSEAALSIDHVVPRSRGGSSEAGNLVLACLRCNSARKDLPLAEWSRVLGAQLGLAPRTVARRVRRQLHKPLLEKPLTCLR